jgi:hypothetical protein
MFFFLPTALAAIVLGWPCQRLNWAWRNVWVTCSINAYVPLSSGSPVSVAGFTSSTAPLTQFPGPSQLDAFGQFSPAGYGPALCQTAPNTGGTFLRNRCRRMLDVYGNLVKLCGQTPAKTNAQPNTLTPDYAPQPGHQPHVVNVQQLGFMAQSCITPGAQFPTPSTTCPGLAGWFTVVWNACMFTNAPAVTAVQNYGTAPAGATYVPNYLTTSSSSAAWSLASPSYLCGNTPEAPGSSLTTTAPNIWNSKGPAFRTSRCRKALDQFGRTAYRCSPTLAPSGSATGGSDPLRFLAQGLGALRRTATRKARGGEREGGGQAGPRV